jgi:hypothetical protein
MLINTGLEDVLKNWEHISEDNRAEYLQQVREFVRTNKSYTGGWAEWNEIVG